MKAIAICIIILLAVITFLNAVERPVPDTQALSHAPLPDTEERQSGVLPKEPPPVPVELQ